MYSLFQGVHLSNRGNSYIHIRINRNASVAAIASLLVHALLLLLLSRQALLNQQQPVAEQRQTINVRLNPRLPKQEAPPPASIPEPSHITHSRHARRPEIKPRSVSPPDAPRVMAAAPVELPSITIPTPPPARVSPTSKPSVPDPAQFTDMMAYVNAVREKRHLAGEDADRINEEAIARERGPSEDEVRLANLKRNLQPSGTNGVFQILSMDAHTAQFAFRGWKNEFSFSHREVYEVNSGQDVERAVVRKMIEIIRRYYTGDFNWESQRLGRVLLLSARLQDNDGLEDFMLQEFFGSRGISAR